MRNLGCLQTWQAGKHAWASTSDRGRASSAAALGRQGAPAWRQPRRTASAGWAAGAMSRMVPRPGAAAACSTCGAGWHQARPRRQGTRGSACSSAGMSSISTSATMCALLPYAPARAGLIKERKSGAAQPSALTTVPALWLQARRSLVADVCAVRTAQSTLGVLYGWRHSMICCLRRVLPRHQASQKGKFM